MPATCFSYSADVPPGIGSCKAAQPALPGLGGMPVWPCFSYPGGPCFSYPADVPRSMPLPCFSYSVDAPLGVRHRGAAQPGQGDLPSLPGGRPGFVSSACLSYPVVPCFRY
jgi:hypothetical protein